MSDGTADRRIFRSGRLRSRQIESQRPGRPRAEVSHVRPKSEQVDSFYELAESQWLPLAEVDRPGLAWARGRWRAPSMFGEVAVLLILSILMLVLLAPSLRRNQARSQLSQCRDNLEMLATGMEMYAADYSAYPTSLRQLSPNYLKTIPLCPADGVQDYSLFTGADAPGNSRRQARYFYLECSRENHTEAAVAGHFPAYSSVRGLIERAP